VPESAPPLAATAYKPTLFAYGVVSTILTVWIAALVVIVRLSGTAPVANERLLAPLYALVALTGVVWLLMVGVRNYAILRDLSPSSYYVAYRGDAPPDWVERPARVFNNLMQVPTLFYVVCLLMMQLGRTDAAELALAWLFVTARLAHSAIYVIWNFVPARFASWLMGVFVLIAMWLHLAAN
jgi:hypothetical protein